MPSKIISKHDIERILCDLNELCIQKISDIMNIHMKIDPPCHTLSDTDDDIFYRMRKIYCHAMMIKKLGNDDRCFHVIAVECRVAEEQICQIFKIGSKDRFIRKFHPFVHPSPTLLRQKQYKGELARDHDIHTQIVKLMMLIFFGIGYASSLCCLSEDYSEYKYESILEKILFNFIDISDAIPHEKMKHVFHKK